MSEPQKAAGRVASVMQESRVFPPPAEFSRRARIGSLDDYRRIYDVQMRDQDELIARGGQVAAAEAAR